MEGNRLIEMRRILEFNADNVVDPLKEENSIGKGGARRVYKGVMTDGEIVVVKRFPTMSCGPSHYNGFIASFSFYI